MDSTSVFANSDALDMPPPSSDTAMLPDIIDPGMSAPAGDSGWTATIQGLVRQGGNIAQQSLAPLLPGEYVQTAQGVRARGVPGAIPGQMSVGPIAGLSSTTLLIGGVVIVGLMMLGARHSK
jgi:hypothetical protein